MSVRELDGTGPHFVGHEFVINIGAQFVHFIDCAVFSEGQCILGDASHVVHIFGARDKELALRKCVVREV